MNDNTHRAASTRPATHLSVSKTENLQPSDLEILEPAAMEDLLQEWGEYMRLRAKIQKLFTEEAGGKTTD